MPRRPKRGIVYSLEEFNRLVDQGYTSEQLRNGNVGQVVQPCPVLKGRIRVLVVYIGDGGDEINGADWRVQLCWIRNPGGGRALWPVQRTNDNGYTTFIDLEDPKAYELRLVAFEERVSIEVDDVSNGADGVRHAEVTLESVHGGEYGDGWRAWTCRSSNQVKRAELGKTVNVKFVIEPLPPMTIDVLLERLRLYNEHLKTKISTNPTVKALADMLRASPLTVNFNSSTLQHYRAAEILNGYQVEARYNVITGNIALNSHGDNNYDLRLYAEHVGFGYPFDRARTTHASPEPVAHPRRWTDDCKIGKALAGTHSIADYSALFDYTTLRYRPHRPTIDPDLRPKYGALDYRNSGRGAAPDPFYGKSFFKFKDALKKKATYTLGDSWNAVTEEGDTLATYDSLELLIVKAQSTPEKKLLSHLVRRCVAAGTLAAAPVAIWYDAAKAVEAYSNGDQYIELQILGPVTFDEYIEGIYIARSECGHMDAARAKRELDPNRVFQAYTWHIVDDV